MRGLVAWGVLIVLFASAIPPAAAAEPVETIETATVRLPYPWQWGAAVWTGSAAYLLGGFWVTFDDEVPILRFDPITNTLREEPVRLPCTRISAVWTGSEILVFGGYCEDVVQRSSRVWRYEPQTETLSVVGELPSPRDNTAAVFDGRYAYVIGGVTAGSNATGGEIVRFDPQTREAVVLSQALPRTFQRLSATWDGTRVVVFTASGPLWFDPASRQLSNPANTAGFPAATQASTVQAGHHAYLFGGRDAYNRSVVDRIIRYDSRTDEGVRLPTHLPRPLADSAAVWTGDRALIFGGADEDRSYDTILELRLVDPAPLVVGVALVGVVAALAVVYALRRHHRKSSE